MKRFIVIAIATLLTAIALLRGTQSVIGHVEPHEPPASTADQIDELPAALPSPTVNLKLSDDKRYFVWRDKTIALVGNSSSYLPHVERKRPGNWDGNGKNEYYDPVFENCTYDKVGFMDDGVTPKRKFHVCVDALERAGVNHMKIWVGLNHSVGRLRNEGPDPRLNQVQGESYDNEQPFVWIGDTTNKWDLQLAYDKRNDPGQGFDNVFFSRLKEVVTYCQKKEIIVAVELFDPFLGWVGDPGQPKISPWWAANNNLGLQFTEHKYFGRSDDFTTNTSGNIGSPIDQNIATNAKLRDIQVALLKRTAYELKDLKNFYWVLSNEPDFGGVAAGQPLITWLRYMANQLRTYEGANYHLIGVNVFTDPPSLTGHPASTPQNPVSTNVITQMIAQENVDIIASHYVQLGGVQRSGGFKIFAKDRYGAMELVRKFHTPANKKVWGFNEDRPDGLRGWLSADKDPYNPAAIFDKVDKDWAAAATRVAAWEFLMNGGGLFDHLSYRWGNDDPEVDGPDYGVSEGNEPQANKSRRQLGYLSKFINTLDLNGMQRTVINNSSWIFWEEAPAYGEFNYWSAMSRARSGTAPNQKFEKFLFYIHRSHLEGAKYEPYHGPTSSKKQTTITATNLTNPGCYRAEWYYPSGETIGNRDGLNDDNTLRAVKKVTFNSSGITTRQKLTSPPYLQDVLLTISWVKAEPCGTPVVTEPELSGPGRLEFDGSSFLTYEGDGQAVVHLTREDGSTGSVSVNYATTSGGTATSGQDYTPTSGTLTFAPGETSKSFNITVANDTTVESNETINVILSNPTGGATLGTPSTAVVTIEDNDGPTSIPGALQFEAGSFPASEGEPTEIQVNRVGGSLGAVSVSYSTSNGSAIGGQDYTPTSGTLVFAAGETSKTFNIDVADDTSVESEETINLTLSNPTGGATLGNPSTAVVTIYDDDEEGGPTPGAGELQFDGGMFPGAEGGGFAVIQVNRVNGSTGTVAVNYATSDGTATAGLDYTATSGTLTFLSGETSKSFNIPITDDSLYEGNESINVTLSNPTGGAILGSPSTGFVMVFDNDQPPTGPGEFRFDGGVFVGSEAGGVATVQVNRVNGSTGTVSVSYSTSNGTATAGMDYTHAFGTLTFLNGETSKSFNIPIIDDAINDPNETINVMLSNPTGGAITGSPSAAYVMILDNDDATPTPTPTPTPASTPPIYRTTTNVALASNGGWASASSTLGTGYPAGAINNGEVKGTGWGSGTGGWADATPNTFPDYLELHFNGERRINEIDLFTVQDNYANPSVPTADMIFTQYGVTSFRINYWDSASSQWITLTQVDGNNKVWRKLEFPALKTPKLSIMILGGATSYSRVVEIEAWEAPASTNVALAANGGQASASSTLNSSYPASGIINGDSRGAGWGAGTGGWHDATGSAFPDYLELQFSGEKRINEIDFVTLQDNYANPMVPTQEMTFSQFGVTSFRINYWDSATAQWITLTQVDGNNKVWRRLKFPAIKTSKLSIMILGGATNYSRVVEIEAWEAPAATNVALAANGGQVSASSTINSSYPASAIINGDSRGAGWGAGTGGWHDATSNTFPDYLEIQFSGEKRINAIDLVTLQDNYTYPIVPTQEMTFTQFGVTSFRINYWESATGQWITLAQVDGNNKVWRKLEFPAIKTPKLSIMILGGAGNYSRVVEIEAWEAPASTNVALAANGGQAVATSTYNSLTPAAGAINGDRRTWGNGAGWNDGTANQYPDQWWVDFNGPKRIDTVNIFTVQDNYNSPQEPTLDMPFTLYGLVDFDVYYLNSAGTFSTLAAVRGNDKVWRQIKFEPVTTTKIMVYVYNARGSYSRLAEVEAWTAPPSNNVALAANGGQTLASSTHSSGYAAVGAINGERRGSPWGGGAGWNDATYDQYPDQWWVDFNGPKRIDTVNIFTLQDGFTNPLEPTLDMTFSLYGLIDFDVYYMNSAGQFITLEAVRGNTRVWRQVKFPPITTTKIFIHVYNAKGYSRITEVEAWEAP